MGKKKRPVPIIPAAVKSRKRARKIITSFHKLTNEEARLASAGSGSAAKEAEEELQEVQRKIDELGGRQAYQSASLLSVSFHNTSKWVTQMIQRLGIRPKSGQSPLKVLEVGAINARLINVPWLDVRAIDLKSQLPDLIEEIDFFAIEPKAEYDIVVSSMVINSVPSPEGRGKMLLGYRQHLKPGGHLFLMLPILCLTQQSRTTRERFGQLLKQAGFEVVEVKETPKVAFYCATTAAVTSSALSASGWKERQHLQAEQGTVKVGSKAGSGTIQGETEDADSGAAAAASDDDDGDGLRVTGTREGKRKAHEKAAVVKGTEGRKTGAKYGKKKNRKADEFLVL